MLEALCSLLMNPLAGQLTHDVYFRMDQYVGFCGKVGMTLNATGESLSSPKQSGIITF